MIRERKNLTVAVIFVLLLTALLLWLKPNIKKSQAPEKSFANEEETATFNPSDLPDPTEIIVKFKQGTSVSNKSEIYSLYGLEQTNDYPDAGFVTVKPGKASIVQTISNLLADNRIEYAEPNYFRQLYFTPNDPGYSQQWWLPKINAPQAWDITRGKNTIYVGVVDSGVNINHPDLVGKIYKTMNSQRDEPEHGTHVAGIIAATTNNALGVASAGFETKLLLADAGDSSEGFIDAAKTIAGIRWAADNGASVINLSFGGSEDVKAERDAISYAMSKGSLIVAAAGNLMRLPNGKIIGHEKTYPASYPGVVSVAATTQADILANFSNYGDWITMAAPGYDIYSTIRTNEYINFSGTSMAAPVVAGVAALIKAVYPTYTYTQIADRLCQTADKITGTGTTQKCGRVNAFKAVSGGATTQPTQSAGPTSTAAASTSPGSSPQNPNYYLKLRFQGIDVKSGKQKIKVSMTQNGRSVLAQTIEAQSDNQGLYTVGLTGNLVSGTYEVIVKGPSHLQRKFQNLVFTASGQTLDLTKTEAQLLKSGDANGDNKISIEDVSLASSYYNTFSTPVAAGDNRMEGADITKDGNITIQDLALIAINWSEFSVPGDN